MTRLSTIWHAVALLALPISVARSETEAVGFDDLPLAADSFWNGPDPDGDLIPGVYGIERVGRLVSGGAVFVNAVDTTNANTWRGFAYSNRTPNGRTGLASQFDAAPGSGRGPGDDTYAIATGYHDLARGPDPRGPFDPTDTEHLNYLPTIEIPFGRESVSLWITNNQYTVDVVRNGNPFSKPFGGASGSDPDWFKVTAYGTDQSGQPLSQSVDLYLADYRFADPAEDYLLTDWAEWDLSSLADARRLHFNLTSSDVGDFGMNTPAYFAIDDLTLGVTGLPGDYNLDGRVDAADYTVWRDARGGTVDRFGAGADGDLSGVIDAGDHAVWRERFGQSDPGLPTNTSVPEPTSRAVMAGAVLILTCFVRSRSAMARRHPSLLTLMSDS